MKLIPAEEVFAKLDERDRQLRATWGSWVADHSYLYYRLIHTLQDPSCWWRVLNNHLWRDYYHRVKWFIQRGRRGWADCDVWGLDEQADATVRGARARPGADAREPGGVRRQAGEGLQDHQGEEG